MRKTTSLSFTALGLSLILAGILVKSYPLLDPLGNIGFPYLAGMLGLAVLVVGIHCLVFSSPVRELPLLPNIVLFAIVAGAANVNIVWDGVVIGYSNEDIWLNLGNSLEFCVYYAAFLFLPRWKRMGGTETAAGSSTDEPDQTAPIENAAI